MNGEFIKIREYLELVDSDYIKKFMIGILLLINLFNLAIVNFINDMGIKQSIYQPKNIIYITVTIILDLWSIYILVNSRKKQKQFVLFSGIVAFVSAIIWLVEFCELFYFFLNEDALIYIIISILIFIYILLTDIRIINQFREDGYSKFDRKINKNKIISFIIVVIIIGGMFYNSFFKFPYEKLDSFPICFSLLVFSCILANLVHNIYKYYLIKKYEQEFDRYYNKILK